MSHVVAVLHRIFHFFIPKGCMPDGYLPPKEVFKKALRNESFEGALRRGGIVTLREHFDGSWSLYISDTGGQMEFQEILPLLVSGPSLFFIVFPLHRDLNDNITD